MTQAASPEALKTLARADLAALGFPHPAWSVPTLPDEPSVEDVLIVGGGQSGLMSAAALTWDGLKRVALIDAAPRGGEGPWTTFARMAELRTLKSAFGIEFNIPSLSVRAFIEARDGAGAWERFARVPREDWKAYLDWYADVFGLAVESGSQVVDVGPDPCWRPATTGPALGASPLSSPTRCRANATTTPIKSSTLRVSRASASACWDMARRPSTTRSSRCEMARRRRKCASGERACPASTRIARWRTRA